MKKFKFTLDKVLEVRRITEKEKQRQLAEALRVLEKETKKFEQLNKQKQNSWLILESLKKTNVDPAVITIVYKGLDGQQTLTQLQDEKVSHARKNFNVKRNELIEVQRKKKILEKLREKQYKIYTNERDKEEQKFIDEIAVIKSGRKLVNKDMQ